MENREVRLIDANACSSKLNGLGYDFGESGDYDFGGGLLHAAKIVEEQPTVDPESLRPHGKWKLEREPYGRPYCFHCSVCDSDFHYIGIIVAYDYCPNCGAKMDDIEEDDFDDDFDPGEDWEASRCYECGAYGDDYSTDENGEMVCNCDRCPYNSMNKED